eukprot:10872394-Alexandrium_andersonii.AAC.1
MSASMSLLMSAAAAGTARAAAAAAAAADSNGTAFRRPRAQTAVAKPRWLKGRRCRWAARRSTDRQPRALRVSAQGPRRACEAPPREVGPRRIVCLRPTRQLV